MKKLGIGIILSTLILVFAYLTILNNRGFSNTQPSLKRGSENKPPANSLNNEKTKSVANSILNKYSGKPPSEWGEKVTGVITKLQTNDKVIALTFDACGGNGGNGYDKKLIDYLISENIPATLFVNYRWIDENMDTFKTLAQNPLFEIENHGYMHKPLSTTGKSVYGIKGTENINEVIDEITLNDKKIQSITGNKPRFFRSGTAYYDNISVQIAQELGYKVIGFDVIGDAGATFTKDQIIKASHSAKNGSIIIYHFNHPEKYTAEGLKVVLPQLIRDGFKFVKLSDYIR